MSAEMEMASAGVQIAKNDEPNGEPTCKFYFENNPNRVYYTGQVVNGCVNLTIYEAITVKGIYANVVGRGYCCWKATISKSAPGNHMKEEFYFNRKIYYVGSQNTTSRTIVQPGEYKYLFNSDIPEECHTSIEEDTGFIRYSVVVVIEEDVDKKKEFAESFTVINPLNLNDDESYSYPMNDETEVVFNKYCCCLCCWETEPVKISAKVPMKGYAPGQAIEITINVDNKSDQTYDNFFGNIFKKTEFYANERTSSSREKLATAKCEGSPAGQSVSRKLIIIVPPTPRTEISNICSISYELTVDALADFCREDSSFVFPLTVGSYPILKTNTDTGGIVVTQQPTIGMLSEQVQSTILNDPSQTQPLLVKENVASQQHSHPGASSVGQVAIDLPDYQVGESTRSDKDFANSYRPLYPVYSNNRFQLACNLKVEAIEMEPIKM